MQFSFLFLFFGKPFFAWMKSMNLHTFIYNQSVEQWWWNRIDGAIYKVIAFTETMNDHDLAQDES